MRKSLLLLMFAVLMGAAKMNDNRAEIINVVDYGGFNGPNGYLKGDFYLGQIHLNNVSKELWFEPVLTNEKVGSGKISQLWQKFATERPRLYIAGASTTINTRLDEFRKNGIYSEDTNGKRIVIPIGNSNFPEILKANIAARWGIVDPETGEKYFKNGWSESRNNELSENREYYSFKYPFQKISKEEFINIQGIIK